MFSSDIPMFSSGDGSPLILACATGNTQAVLSLLNRQNINSIFFFFFNRVFLIIFSL